MLTIKNDLHDPYEMEKQIGRKNETEILGEVAFLRNCTRTCNARAIGGVKCMLFSPELLGSLLIPLRELLSLRHDIREKQILDNIRLFNTLDKATKNKLIDHIRLKKFKRGEYLCKQGDIDSEFFFVTKGVSKVIQQARGKDIEIARIGPRQGIGELALLGHHARTANVIAATDMVCGALTREDYEAVTGKGVGDQAHLVDPKNIAAEDYKKVWDVVKSMEALDIHNPKAMRYVTEAAASFRRVTTRTVYNSDSVYIDLLRRVVDDPSLTAEFPDLASRIPWDCISEALVAIYKTTRKITSKRGERTDEEIAFLARLIENLPLLDEFCLDKKGNKYKSAKVFAPLLRFMRVRQKDLIFPQGVIEGRAYTIISGIVYIVSEDIVKGVRQYETLATLRAGISFGELSLTTKMERTASAVAAIDTDLLFIQREEFQKSVRSQGLQVRHVMVDRSKFLKSLPYFKSCSPKVTIRNAHFMGSRTYQINQIILKEDVVSQSVFIIVTGAVAVLKNRNFTDPKGVPRLAMVQVAELSRGECIGSSMLPPREPEEASYLSKSEVTVLEISEKNWRRLDGIACELMRQSMIHRNQHENSMAENTNTEYLLLNPKRPWCPAKVNDLGTSLDRRVATLPGVRVKDSTERAEELWDQITDDTGSDPELSRPILNMADGVAAVVPDFKFRLNSSPCFGSFTRAETLPKQYKEKAVDNEIEIEIDIEQHYDEIDLLNMWKYERTSAAGNLML